MPLLCPSSLLRVCPEGLPPLPIAEAPAPSCTAHSNANMIGGDGPGKDFKGGSLAVGALVETANIMTATISASGPGRATAESSEDWVEAAADAHLHTQLADERGPLSDLNAASVWWADAWVGWQVLERPFPVRLSIVSCLACDMSSSCAGHSVTTGRTSLVFNMYAAVDVLPGPWPCCQAPNHTMPGKPRTCSTFLGAGTTHALACLPWSLEVLA
jgi:hypothetical protein